MFALLNSCAKLLAVRKSFQYRIYPSKRQFTLMRQTLDECRWLYNHLLEQRKIAYEERNESLSLYGQQATFPLLKKERESLKTVHSQVLQNVAVRIDLAFKAFFRRVKAKQNPGYPRFRGANRYDSFCFPQGGFKVKGHHLKLSKIGNVHIVLHRPIEGKIKTCCVRRSSTGKWYATFSCEVEAVRLPDNDIAVGIDVGIQTFAHLSTDEKIGSPKFFRSEQKALAKVQRRLSKEEKGTPERVKRRKPVSRVHERIRFKRHNFVHQEARKIVNRFGYIFVEDLNVNRMMHESCLAKSIADASWSMFFDLLFSKAEEAGRTISKVNPAYTSQNCSKCGHRQKMPLNVRLFDCPCCHIQIDRDFNASLNILAIGLDGIGNQSVEAPALMRGE